MKSQLRLFTSFVSPTTLRRYVEEFNMLPIFIVRSMLNSSLVGKYHGTAVHFKELSPSTELFRARRDQGIDLDDFKKRYILEIAPLNFIDLIKRLESLVDLSNARGVVLLGYGTKEEECHRSVLSGVLNSSGLLEHRVTEIIL